MIYVFTFSISILLFYFADYYLHRRKRFLFIFFSFFAIFIPCLLASLRDPSIGTDVNVYVYPMFILAKSVNFSVYFAEISHDAIFFIILYITSFISDSISLALFIFQFLTIFPLFYAAYKYRDRLNIASVFVLYYLFFYNYSFSMMRQMIACSFALLAFYFLSKHKYFPFIIYCAIGTSFHFSCLFILLFEWIILFVMKKNKLNGLILMPIVVLIVIFSNVIIGKFAEIGIIPYYYYERFSDRMSEIDLSNIDILIWGLINIGIVVLALVDKCEEYTVMVLNTLFALIFLFAMHISSTYFRIDIYFKYFILLIVPILFKSKSLSNFSLRIVTKSSFYLLGVVFWLFFIVYVNYFNTYPYVFFS